MKNHTDLLNYLIERYNLQSYLEIGVQNTASNFDKIKCKFKEGVDPEVDHIAVAKMTSDDFFSVVKIARYNLIFIDGLHHAEQVERDFENSLKCLTDTGFIVIHDCWPLEEKTTQVPRATKVWYGNVYKFAMRLREYNGIDFVTWAGDCGCCIIWKDKNKKSQGETSWLDLQWNNYIKLRSSFLREFSFQELPDRLPPS